jgi:uncharacterized RDD family membrane protein YckC
MKCPVCDFITNPGKDLCSRCFSDLRPLKSELGLKIQDPDLSYEDLLSKKVKIVDADTKQGPKVAKEKNTSLFDTLGLKKLFATKPVSKDPDSDMELVLESENEASAIDSTKSEGTMSLRLGKRQRAQVVALLNRRQEKLEQAKKNTAKTAPLALSFNRANLDSESELLFTQVAQEIHTDGSFVHSSDIGLEQLLKFEDQPELKVLFELVSEEITQPNKSRNFIDPLLAKKVEQLDSEKLTQAVKEYDIENVEYELKQAADKIHFAETLNGEPASLYLRIKAFCLDFTICFMLSLVLAVFFEIISTSLISRLMLGEFEANLQDLFTLIIYATGIFGVLYLLVLPVWRVLCRGTIGEKTFNIRLVDLRQRPADLVLSLLWSSASIFAVMTCGLSELLKIRFLQKEKICLAKILRC